MENDTTFELLTKMYEQMQEGFKSLREEQTKTNDRLGSLETKVDKGFEDVNKRIDTLKSDIANLVTNDIAEGISNQIKDVKQDVEFLTHKLNS